MISAYQDFNIRYFLRLARDECNWKVIFVVLNEHASGFDDSD